MNSNEWYNLLAGLDERSISFLTALAADLLEQQHITEAPQTASPQ